ncbi:ABC transporter permease [Natrinema longum]|uniref:ABC transporter permease n=1 Tax=Natrinema longum TaxID=370324 RepID=UPI001CCFB109|nr:ABC transporter permease [Natrinema longum]MBZ6496825.1 ABC transporter permease [Natrinema longum]
MSDLVRPVVAVALADLKERSRSPKLLVVPILVSYFVKVVTVDTTLVVGGDYTGAPTSAWFAGTTTVIGTTVFFLFGFSFVSGTIARDRATGVGELVASSPLSNGQYLLGKWLSHVVVLGATTGVLLVSTGIAFLRQGTGGFDLWAFVSPFLFITLPTMAAVAAAAVCFETIGPLRGTAGTVVYFFAALIVLLVGLAPNTPDPVGLEIVRESVVRSISAQYPSSEGMDPGFTYTDDPGSTRTVTWEGVAWTTSNLASRVSILAVAVGLLGVATVAFDRFDDSSRWSFLGGSDHGTDGDAESVSVGDRLPSTRPSSVDIELAPITRDGGSIRHVLLAELRMALRGYPRWWYVVCSLAAVTAGLAPIGAVRTVVVPTALLLPLSAWSSLGARERIHRTEPLVFVGSRPLQVLGSTYVSGVLVGLVVTFPAPIRFGVSGLYGALVGWGVGLLFLPALALAMGVWTGRPKTFEITYLTAWYLGPVNGLGFLDYLGVQEATVASGTTLIYGGLTILALGAAFLGRTRR